MITSEVRKRYQATIGIECHVQLKTISKLFSGANNDAREAPPNTLVNHIDFGLPGALPVLNVEALHLAARAAFALNTVPQKFSKFDRKHYFYPDLPMGYQITQFDQPIILGGTVEIEVDGQKKVIGITRAHLEADAGKSVHPAGKDYSLVDLNRAGTPLLEIVSEPDLKSAMEAKAYAHELYLCMKYADVSEANLYYGNMRFDVNVSVSTSNELGTRTETKNINSFRAVEKVVDFEINRQIEQLEKGAAIIQETRGWDDAKQKTFSQRSKENADDYRYMPDPDIPPIVLDDAYIENIKAEMPALPDEYRKKFSEVGIDDKTVEDIISSPDAALLVMRILEKAGAEHARRVAFWFMQVMQDEASGGVDEAADAHTAQVSDEQFIGLSTLVSNNELSSTAGKDILKEMLRSGGNPKTIAQTMNLLQVSDEAEINKIVTQVLSENAKAAEDVKNGEMKAIGFLVGQVMKLSQGKANPKLAQDLIKQQLDM
jgi:aspartyl-tRNA(Asn)/glutamyl-tRNA(Gln) amidotransferase subunit B